jgi:nondiscriminating aspartyl-tRNA synthetase
MLVEATERLQGVVKEIRTFKWGGFFLLETFNGIIQCVVNNGYDLSKLKSESYVDITGNKKDAKIKKELVVKDYEIEVSSIEVISQPTEELPFNIYEKEIVANIDTILNNRQVSLRNESFKSVFKVQSTILNSFRGFYDQMGFTSISTPKIVAEGAEGGTNVFKLDYFGKDAFLAQSPQFYKQMMCGVFGKVYETAPVFRAEKHNTSRHVNEYTSLDVEMILPSNELGLGTIIESEKLLLNQIFRTLEEKNKPELDYLQVELPTMDNIQNAAILTVSEIKSLLGTENSEIDLTGEEEIAICKYAKEKFNTDFVFATHYSKDARPFYTKISSDGVTTQSFDLLYKGMEITSGGQRKESYQEYVTTMEELGMNTESFSSYLDTFKYGMPLHGGFAIGLERLTAKICNLDSVKLATLFPRDINRLTP